jgi:hypothetical protein
MPSRWTKGQKIFCNTMSHYRQQRLQEDGEDVFVSNPYLSQNPHNPYTSPYYSDGRTPPIQRLAIEAYIVLKGWIFSYRWYSLLSITVVAMILVQWFLQKKRRQHRQQQHDLYLNPFCSVIQSMLPSSVLALLDTFVSMWLYFSAFLESVMRLRLQIKTGSREGRESRNSANDQSALQRRVFPESLPELEEIENIDDTTSQARQMQNHEDETQEREFLHTVELEPAFTDPSKYPPGWLTYHPMFGLIDIKDLNRIKKSPEVPLSVTISEIR